MFTLAPAPSAATIGRVAEAVLSGGLEALLRVFGEQAERVAVDGKYRRDSRDATDRAVIVLGAILQDGALVGQQRVPDRIPPSGLQCRATRRYDPVAFGQDAGIAVMEGGRMFRKRHHLLRDGAQAQAVVTDARRSGGNSGVEGGKVAVQYRLELRVHFPDGSTANASCRVGGAFLGTGLWFYAGDIVPVRYDPADRSQVAVDEPALTAQRDAELKAGQDAAVARAERRLAGLPEPSTRPLPTDAELQSAYHAWRTAITRTKQSKADHKRAEASGDRRETLRLFNQRMTRSAEEKSARAKFDRLHNLRPDWTNTPEDARG